MQTEYRQGVAIVLLNKEGKIFGAKRLRNNITLLQDTVQMVQGGIEEGESVDEAFNRELGEEVGLSSADIMIIDKIPDLICYKLPKDWISSWWGGKYIGQCHRWFLCRLLNENAINIHTKDAEFKSFEWLTPEELLSQAPDFKRDVYIQVFNYFKDKIVPLNK